MSHIPAKAMPHARPHDDDQLPAAKPRRGLLLAVLGGVAAIAAFSLVRAVA
jgi:hypothetical protein